MRSPEWPRVMCDEDDPGGPPGPPCGVPLAAGHVLFTKARPAEESNGIPLVLLAPLAVVPASQRRGVGRALIEHGVGLLASTGVQLVFVLEGPRYYRRCGFVPAISEGLLAPYPIVPQEASMVRPLVPDVLGAARGTVACAISSNLE